MVMSN
jgi:hypothetical protein